MGTTAEKLTYLNDTKGLIKDNINLTGAGLTNQTPFRQYATDLKTALLNILNNGIDSLYNNFPKTTGTGTNISLNNTLQAPIRSVINGDTYQFSTTGKQLYDISTVDYTYKCALSNGIYTTDALTTNARSVNFGYDANNNYTINDGETYYVSADIRLKSGTSTNVNVLRFNVSGLTTTQISNPNFTSQFQRYAFSCANNSGSAITTGRFLFQPSSTNLDNAVFEITNVMVSTSSNTSYEPYTGGIASPNPSYPQNIQCVTGLQKVAISGGTGTTPQEYEINLGKNLEDFSTINYQIVNQATGTRDGGTYTIINGSGSAYGRAIFKQSDLKLQPNTTYTFSAKVVSTTNETGSSVYVDKYFSNTGGQIWGTQVTAGNRSYATFTTPAEISSDAVIGIYPRGASNEAVFTDIQLEKSTQATSFSPYFTPIELNKIGDYQDRIYKDNGKWYIEKQIGKVILDGSENWSENGENTDYGQYSLSISNKQYGNDLLSDKFIPHTGSTGNYIWGRSTNNNIYITIAKSIISYGLATFKTWLSTHNTEVLYVLATPEYTEITNTELIEQLNAFYNAKSYNGQTNISVDGDLSMILDVSAIINE